MIRIQRLLTCVILCAQLIPCASSAQTLQPKWWITNGQVNAIVQSGNTVYLGGSFTYVGPYMAHGAALDNVTGLPNLSFSFPNGKVQVAIADGSGGWFIGGEFTQIYTRKYGKRIIAINDAKIVNPERFKENLILSKKE